SKPEVNFPPSPAAEKLIHKIMTDWTESFSPRNLEEIGCAVCGQLKPCINM
ncbi:hypothetical protein K435DRAFT_620394, partial [Dendrothele bispora CBS 962.96]